MARGLAMAEEAGGARAGGAGGAGAAEGADGPRLRFLCAGAWREAAGGARVPVACPQRPGGAPAGEVQACSREEVDECFAAAKR